MTQKNIYDNLSPLDYRYWDEEIASFFSESAFLKYKIKAEAALVSALADLDICSKDIANEVTKASEDISAAEVYEEEKITKHDIGALVNCIQRRVSDKAKPFVHFSATSCDIVNTANSARYKDATLAISIPRLKELERILIDITLREATTIQVGRTHGQHAVPITFGFAVTEYVSRLGESILKLKELTRELVGKFSGAVGAYNTSTLFFNNPESFEKNILKNFDLNPAEHSTQITPPETLTRLLSEYVIVAGILANLSDDMRHLQRTEIGEVGEEFEKTQVGSSTMPQKRNPINFESAKSIWKVLMPQMMTVYMDQISEHQRDLTNSASSRTYVEIVAYTLYMTKRLTLAMGKLKVDHTNLKRNFEMQKDMIMAEPLYIILASLGHSSAHEKVKQLTLKAQRTKKNLLQLACSDPELNIYFDKMTKKQKLILWNPEKYTGIAAQKAEKVAENWKIKLGL